MQTTASMDAYKIILLIHVAFGFSALATGVVPMIAKKGGKLHKFWGNVYYWSMFGVFTTTLALFALRPDQLKMQFFLCIAILSFYLTFSGERVLKMKKNVTQATLYDRLAAALALVSGMAMLTYAGYAVVILQNYFIPILFTVFGLGLTLNARKDWQLFTGKIEAEKMHWYFGHISKIMGAYIATVTAFCVNMTRYLPEDASVYLQLIPWLTPGVLLGVGTAYYTKRQKEKHNLPVQYGLLTRGLRWALVR